MALPILLLLKAAAILVGIPLPKNSRDEQA